MVEALVVFALVAAFLAVAGLAALTVYRLWTGVERSGVPANEQSGTPATGAATAPAGAGSATDAVAREP